MPSRKLLIFFLASASCFAPAAFASPPHTIVVDNFEHAAPKDALGGFIGCDGAPPGVCRFSYSFDTQDTFGKATHSLRIDYDVRSQASYTYLWLHLGPEGKDKKIQTLDLSRHKYLSFWVKAGRRGENFKVELHADTNDSGRYEPGEDGSAGVQVDRYLGKEGLREDWRKVVIPLADFVGIGDLSRAMEIVFVFENLRGNRQGHVILDEILFGVRKAVHSSQNAPMPTPVILRPDLPGDATRELLGGSEQRIEARHSPCGIMEGVGFEVSWDEGKNWALAGVDYDTAKEKSAIVWKIPLIPPSSKAWMRCFSLGVGGQQARGSNVVELAVRAYPDKELLSFLARRTFHYFKDNQHEKTGLFLDSAGGNASTAVTGFGLAALAIGAYEGWMDKNEAMQRACRTLLTYRALQQNPRSGECSKDGMFYHFLKPSDATRAGTSEISVVDTALFLYGAFAAGEYFGGEAKRLAQQIYDGVEWDKFFDAKPALFRMAWSPEKGYFPNHWDFYTDEAMLIHFLAAASRTSPTPSDSFYNFRRERGRFGDGNAFVYSWTGTMFTYQYAAAWLNLRGWQDRQGWNWWDNSRDALRASRDYCWYSADRPNAYGPHRWGISCFNRPEGYTGHFGVTPNGANQAQEDGTLSPIACASAITFLPFESLADLKIQLSVYPFLFGPYGLRNSYNLDRHWFSTVDFGLDCGLLLLSLDNARDGLVWKMLQKNSVVQRGVGACGLRRVAASERLPQAILPALPEGASAALREAQQKVQKVENLCMAGDGKAFRACIQAGDALMGKATDLLQSLSGQGAPAALSLRAHAEWLKALMALRKAAVVPMRRYFGRMMQYWAEGEEGMGLDVMRRYLDYIVAADLRDFQDGAYGAFRAAAQARPGGVEALEDFARHAQRMGRFRLSARVWKDALVLRGRDCAARVLGDYARRIAEEFLRLGRQDEAISFDRIFLEHVQSVRDPALAQQLSDLGKRYAQAGAVAFSRECYAQAARIRPALSWKSAGSHLAERNSS